MTWIGLRDPLTTRFATAGLRRDGVNDAPVSPDRVLARGTVMLETAATGERRPNTLLSIQRDHPWNAGLTIRAVPGGGLAVVCVQGDHVAHAAVDPGAPGRAEVLRITYAWDAPRRWGRLAVELPGTGLVRTTTLEAPAPLPLAEVQQLMLGAPAAFLDPVVSFVALSDRVEPIGPQPTLGGATPIATPGGDRPIADLRRGQHVLADRQEPTMVLETLSRLVPARGSFAPVRLRAPYFGLSQDIIVAPDQRLVMGGAQVEYLFGAEAVLVPARHLVNGVSAVAQPCGPLVRYHQILLPRHAPLVAAGSAVESLYIGRLRRHRERLAETALAHATPRLLPDHARAVYPILRPFEAVTLAESRAA